MKADIRVNNMTSKAKTPKRTPTPQKSYDDRYIESYTNNPKAGKTSAILDAGYVGDYARQTAHALHKRLSARIHEAFTDKIKNLEGKAIQNIEIILDTDIKEVGVSNMLAASTKALEFAGRKASDTLIVKQEKSIDNLDENITRLQKEIADKEGSNLH